MRSGGTRPMRISRLVRPVSVPMAVGNARSMILRAFRPVQASQVADDGRVSAATAIEDGQRGQLSQVCDALHSKDKSTEAL